MRTVYLHGFGGTQVGPRAIDKGLKQPNPLFFDLPNFGSSPDIDLAECACWHDYVQLVIRDINEQIPPGETFKIVAHSHGALLAYALATEYPERVDSMILLCPLASGSPVSHFCLSLVQRVAWAVGMKRAVNALKATVDIATVVSWQPNWPSGTMHRMIHQRRAESRRYNTSMLELLFMIPAFANEYKNTTVRTPTTIVFARGDLAVAGADEAWYRTHLPEAVVVKERLHGGHLMPDIHPHRLAEVLAVYDAL